MLRPDPYWRTRFGSIVSGIGVSRIVCEFTALGDPIRPTTIYNWVYGIAAPSFDRCVTLTQATHGEITLADISAHRTALRQVKR